MHVILRARAGPGGDWAVEGLSELYSLEALVRSKTISKRRYEKALARLAEKGRGVSRVTVEHATGAVTARSVGLLLELGEEIKRASNGTKDLDDVVRALAESPEAISLANFRAIAESVAGASLAPFFERGVLAPPR
jgi:predicted metalloprotease with PDZ domain